MADPNQTARSRELPNPEPEEEDDAEDAPQSSDEPIDGFEDGSAGGPPAANDATERYIMQLSSLELESQRSYDKAILTLSGGALGVTISFLKNVLRNSTPTAMVFLFAAWVCWGLSLASVLYSFYSSNLALRKAISQADRGTISEQQPGGAYDVTTAILNGASGILFLAGIFLFVYFAYANMVVRHG